MKSEGVIILLVASAMLGCSCRRTSDRRDAVAKQAVSDTLKAKERSGEEPATAVHVTSDTVMSGIPGVESLTRYSLCRGNESLPLFKVANGGNVCCLNDTVVWLNGREWIPFAFADYSQTDQIFYIIYNVGSRKFIQTERINLHCSELSINDFKSLRIDSIAADSIFINGKGPVFAAGVIPLDCDSAGIVNYYEYR